MIFNLLAIAIFATFFIAKANYEFIIYVGVIIFFMLVFIATNHKIYYPNALLWGLTTRAVMHMAGGAIAVKQGRLYDIILIPISDKYSILRYDQVVHIIGFGVATILMFYLLKPLLRKDIRSRWAMPIVVIFAGLGVGALNEIIEFITGEIVAEAGVGGYINTSLDLVADLIGAILAVVVIKLTNSDYFKSTNQE